MLCALVLLAACGAGHQGSLESPGRGLRPVSLPDVSQMQGPARAQMQARQTALTTALANKVSDQDLAREFGETGKLLMAATDLERAEPCLLNAQTLAPADPRWPYYLGHVYRIRGPLQKAVESFEQVLQLRPDDFPALVWLGEMRLAEGRSDLAAPLFAKALARDSGSAAALFGAGRTALATRDFAAAAKYLEQTLERQPRATAAHYPLAMAYRGLGDVARAEAHLKLQVYDELITQANKRYKTDLKKSFGTAPLGPAATSGPSPSGPSVRSSDARATRTTSAAAAPRSASPARPKRS